MFRREPHDLGRGTFAAGPPAPGPRYRGRTWLRSQLHAAAERVLPKGRRDCGAHQWYRADDGTWRCRHCRVGISSEPPAPPRLGPAAPLAVLEAPPLSTEQHRRLRAIGRAEDRRQAEELAQVLSARR